MKKPKYRLFVKSSFFSGGQIEADQDQRHYLCHVLCLNQGDRVGVFNGDVGEFEAFIETISHKKTLLRVGKKLREPSLKKGPGIFFAPIKHHRLTDFIERAVELGVSALYPVITDYSANLLPERDRIEQIAKTSLAQSGRLSLPLIDEAVMGVQKAIELWQEKGIMFFCTESGPATPILQVLSSLDRKNAFCCAFFIGPEGGFSADEYDLLDRYQHIERVSLGPALLRSETAMAMALSCWQAVFCTKERPDTLYDGDGDGDGDRDGDQLSL